MSERSESSQSEDRNVGTVASTHTVNNRHQMVNDERISTGAISREDLEEIAEKVYRMMRHDLMLERERAIKIGG